MSDILYLVTTKSGLVTCENVMMQWNTTLKLTVIHYSTSPSVSAFWLTSFISVAHLLPAHSPKHMHAHVDVLLSLWTDSVSVFFPDTPFSPDSNKTSDMPWSVPAAEIFDKLLNFVFQSLLNEQSLKYFCASFL